LKNLSFEIADGEFIALTGRSGSGKSTLLYILSTLDPPTAGELRIDGEQTSSVSSKRLHQFRNQKMGFVFQFHYLLPELNCLENVLIPARKTGRHEELRADAEELMKEFEIDGLKDKTPGKISGGERQRVAIARALIMKPKYLFADEPTGNLDSLSGEKVIRIFERINERHGTTIVMVTHDLSYAARAHRQIGLIDGRVEFNRKTHPTKI
ncbi:MAG: ABC transporter ATP-binding protein, partial [Spirochaetia bacterium]|nr:ABC transporter ATP-binding protein [Spirochaetia bacterium]